MNARSWNVCDECDGEGEYEVCTNPAGTTTELRACWYCRGKRLLDELQCSRCPHICTDKDPPVDDPDYGRVCRACSERSE